VIAIGVGIYLKDSPRWLPAMHLHEITESDADRGLPMRYASIKQSM
jgi:hypothetical protein